MRLTFLFCQLFVFIEIHLCVPVSNNFSDNIRTYAVKEEDAIFVNTTAKTLQQEDLARYAKFAPSRNPIRFKEVPDNALSESNYGKSLHHEHGGYGLHDFDESHYGYGYDYDHYENGLDHHIGYHHGPHFGHGHGHHHHHKHLSHHALAAKSLLWPLAGLAILGTAAALVTNPVLLQLGVISGRRRRDTAEDTADFNYSLWNTDEKVYDNPKGDAKDAKKPDFKTGLKKRVYQDIAPEIVKKGNSVRSSTTESPVFKSDRIEHKEDNMYIPIPIKIKNN